MNFASAKMWTLSLLITTASVSHTFNPSGNGTGYLLVWFPNMSGFVFVLAIVCQSALSISVLFQIGFRIVQTDLEFSMYSRTTLNCPSCVSTRQVLGLQGHSTMPSLWGTSAPLIPGLHACWSSILPRELYPYPWIHSGDARI